MVTNREVELISVDIAMGRDLKDFSVKIDTPELQKAYEALKAEFDEAKAKNWVYEYPSEFMEMPDFEPIKKVE